MQVNKKYWLAFSALKNTGSVFVQRLYEHFSDIETAWNADVSELIKIESITKKQLDSFINERININPDECFDIITSKNIDFITFEDNTYPVLLRSIYNPPMTIFLKGDINRCNLNRTLAVVGSRRASNNAKETLSKILSQFAGTDICIVSGLAAGIDTIAHQTSVDN